MMTNAPRHNHTNDTFELLSAYLDDALDVVERRRADTLLRDCTACAFELDELRMLHQTLRALPVPLPKRSFTLDPAQVRPRMRLFPILRFASLVSAMLLVVILGIDTLGGPRPQPGTSATFMEPAAPEMQRQSTTEAPLAEQDAPFAAEAAPQPTSVAALEAPAAAAAPAAETAEAALAAGAAETTAQADARAAKTPEETEVPAEAAGDDAQDVAPTEAAVAAANAAPTEAATSIAAADAVPGTTVVPEESGAGGAAGAVPPLTNSDPSSLDTATLEQPQPRVGFAEQQSNPWRLAEIILAIVVIILAGATWWTARQRL